MKKLMALLLLCLSVFLTAPTDGFSHDRRYGGHHDGYGGRGYDDGYRGHPRGYYGNHRRHYNDDFYWGATGFLFGTAFGAALYPPPAYSYGPPVYYSPPPMCRYERYVTDQWGRSYVESFVAPCK